MGFKIITVVCLIIWTVALYYYRGVISSISGLAYRGLELSEAD